MALHAAHDLLACPHCSADLDPDGARWVCPSGHSFDVAKQGYLNLSGSAEPANADTAAMLDARARVQSAGVFRSISTGLDQLIPLNGVRTVLEVGAGTGHYLAELVDERPPARGVALDISRAAAKRAAKAHHRVASVVADVWRGLPVRSGAFDVVLCIFAPRNAEEFARVLSPSGRLVVATPTERHLVELRERYDLLGIQPDKTERLLATLGEYLRHERTYTVKSHRPLTPDVLDELIGMGPNAHHNPPSTQGPLAVTLSVELNLFGPLAG